MVDREGGDPARRRRTPADRGVHPPFGRGPFAARVLARVIDAAAFVGCRIPARLADALALLGGHLEWALRPGLRRRLAANLGHVTGRGPTDRRTRRLVRRTVVAEAHRSADLLWALGRPDAFVDRLEVDGLDHARRALAEGRGLLLVSAHIGGWELAAGLPRRLLGVRAGVVAADDWLAWAMEHARVAAGLDIVYRTEPVLGVARRLRHGGVLILLGDHGWGPDPRRHRVRFCDADADLPAGPATLARLAGAPLVGFAVVRVGSRRWRLIVDPPITVGTREEEPTVTQRLADRWTELITDHPDQWFARFPVPWVPRERV